MHHTNNENNSMKFLPSCHSALIQLYADKKINITEKEAWLGTDTILQHINPHENKTLTPKAELLARNGRHERKRKCCGHPCTRVACSCQIASKNFPRNVKGRISEGLEATSGESLPQGDNSRLESEKHTT